MVAPWYLSWSQGWLKLASKEAIAFAFIPGLAVSFFIMPYVEVGRSRRYGDRRVGLSVPCCSSPHVDFQLDGVRPNIW
ncbi:MAG: hypothetical protein IPL28_05385 [Chloroflexi bacterium]|nr:hypothetical protein [Chloroflexota bacterium]